MDIIKIEKEAFVLDKIEKQKLKTILSYAFNEMKNERPVIKGIDDYTSQELMDFIEYMKANL